MASVRMVGVNEAMGRRETTEEETAVTNSEAATRSIY